ncbi:MAG: IS4 family transposase [Acidimicrobiales bacterium]
MERPTKAALFKVRTRLGPEPLEALYRQSAVPLANKATKGAFYRSWRLMSIDGTCLDVADTSANELAFGRPGLKREDSSGAFPQIRVVGLAECGTHAVIDAVIGRYTDSEQRLAAGLLGSFTPGMVVLADRGFFSHDQWTKAQQTGAELLWRTKVNHVLPVERRLGDGSFLSRIYPTQKDRRRQTGGVSVRVVEYLLDPPPPSASGEETRYRLLTTILEDERAPAAELAGLYPERWEFETALDELKTHQRSPRVVLRSKMPEGVLQEAYGYLCVHYAIRWLMHSVADHARADPDRPSFTRALRVARRTAASHPGFPPWDPGGCPAAGSIRAALRAAAETPPPCQSPGSQTQDVELQSEAAGASRPTSPSEARDPDSERLSKRYWGKCPMRTWRVALCTTTAMAVAACRRSSTTAPATGPSS